MANLMFSQILLCTLLAVIGIDGSPMWNMRAEKARENEFPYLAGLIHSEHHICDGVIIDRFHILTAGHCVQIEEVDFVNEVIVVTGTSDVRNGNQHRIKDVKVHESSSLTVGDTVDLAMITLHDPIEFNEHQNAVYLPMQHAPENLLMGSDLPMDFPVQSNGWGVVRFRNGATSTELLKLDMEVISNKDCEKIHVTVGKNEFCAKSKQGYGLCSGDTGGPLVSDGILIGIASFVPSCGYGYPDVFTKVENHLDWINAATKN